MSERGHHHVAHVHVCVSVCAGMCARVLMNRDQVVVENTWSKVIIKSKLTNFKINSRIEGYNGKYGSNPKRIR